MSAPPVIRSRSNPLLKRVGAVTAGRERDWVLLEGARLVADARAAGLELECVLVAEERSREFEHAGGEDVRFVETALLARVSSLDAPPGVLALARRPEARDLEQLPSRADSMLVVTCGLADPGNLGAVARSAEAFGATALCVLPGGASPWNTKALRGSMGSLLRMPLVRSSAAERELEAEASALAAELEGCGFRSLVAATRGGRAPDEVDWSGRIALWIGAETGALPEAARGFDGVTIPIAAGVESLNVAVAASVLLFAAGRAPRVGTGSEP